MSDYLTREVVERAIREMWDAPHPIYRPSYDPTRPRLVGHGPAECSTVTDLAIPFSMAYDTNGYYLLLGLRPDATRLQIRKAYQRLKGWRSSRLTYIVKQLLDPEVRAAYDATPFGSFFYDYEVETLVRRKRAEAVRDLIQHGFATEQAEDLMGLGSEVSDEPSQTLDPEPEIENTPLVPLEWGYAFYLWNTTIEDRERLRQWQELLIRALASQKERTHIAVGLVGGMASPFEVGYVGSRLVAFLSDDGQPTEVLADQVALRVVAHRKMKKSL